MSHSVSPRPLSYVPFFVADGVLLLTALIIAWRTPDALDGGALAGVVICTCLGALIMAVPFVLNEARRREAASEKLQRELLELVTTTTATASHWGAQWTAAATGLVDAAGLASRNLAAAERLPAAVQEKIDALAVRMERFESAALEREARAATLEDGARLRASEASAAAAELARVLAEFEGVRSGLREGHDALSATLGELSAAAAKSDAARRALEELLASAPAKMSAQIEGGVERAATSAEARLTANVEEAAREFERMRTTLREQHEALAATLAGFPVAVANADASRNALAEFVAAAPSQLTAQVSAQLDASIERAAGVADARFSTHVEGLARRFAELETRLGTLAAELERRAVADAQIAASAPNPAQLSEQISAQLDASAARAASEADARFSAHAEELARRFAQLETRLETVVEELAARRTIVEAQRVVAPEPEPALEPVAPAQEAIQSSAVVEPVSEPAASPVVREDPVVTVAVTSEPQSEKPAQTISKESIMDPFYIPDDGYSALADAMDAGPAH